MRLCHREIAEFLVIISIFVWAAELFVLYIVPEESIHTFLVARVLFN